jgi:hypothetical protein
MKGKQILTDTIKQRFLQDFRTKFISLPVPQYNEPFDDVDAKPKPIPDLVRQYNDQSITSRSPVIFTLMLMVMVGGTVNLCVFVVFLKRFPASAIRTYMATLSFFDLLATSIGVPLEIYSVLNVSIHTCKIDDCWQDRIKGSNKVGRWKGYAPIAVQGAS